MTTIRYFIPEDGDEEVHPNVFLAPKPRQTGAPPTLGQVKDSFPLPGHYHFRFKSPLYPGGDRDKGSIPVWMDIVRDNVPVPTWKNSIIAKVTRLSVEEDDDDDDDDDFGHHRAPAPAPHHHQVPTQQQQPPPARAPVQHQSSNVSAASSDHLDIFGAEPAANHSSAPSPVPPAGGPNLFDATPHSHAAAPNSGGSLLDFGAPVAPPAAPDAAHADFFGMTAPAPGSHPTHQQQQQQQQQQQAPPPMNAYQPRPPQQPVGQSFNTGYSQQQASNQPFGNLGTWK